MFKVKINPLFIILLFILSYFGNMRVVIVYFIFLLLHEMGHMYTARLLGYRFDTIDFMPYGLGLQTNNIYISVKNDILITIAGPMINILFITIIVILWWCYPTSYYYTLDAYYVNVSILLMNILPIFPLDGGRILMLLLKEKYRVQTMKIMKVFTIVFIVIFIVLFILSIFTTFNVSYFVMSVFLFMSYDNTEMDIVKHITFSVYSKDMSEPIEVKTFYVKGDIDRYKMIKVLSSRYISRFVVDDGNNNTKIISEKDIISM